MKDVLTADFWKTFFRYAIRGHWHAGCERWEGKPQFSFFRMYWDGWHFCLHIGQFWVEINDDPEPI